MKDTFELTIRLADGSLWFDPPAYVDGSGCSKLGNRCHVSNSPPSYDLLKRYGCDDLIELYDYVN